MFIGHPRPVKPMGRYVSHLECAYTGKRYQPGAVHTVSDDGKPIVVRYDLEAISREVSRESIGESMENGFWRYSALLPVIKKENRISLGEVVTPLIDLVGSCEILGSRPGSVTVKDESRLPTGSF